MGGKGKEREKEGIRQQSASAASDTTNDERRIAAAIVIQRTYRSHRRRGAVLDRQFNKWSSRWAEVTEEFRRSLYCESSSR
jgi:hypothetical protein